MHLLLPIFAGVISSVAELRQAVWSDIHVGDTFSITCTVTAVTAGTGSMHRSRLPETMPAVSSSEVMNWILTSASLPSML